MERDVITALVNNAALLLVLSVIYEAVYFLPSGYRRLHSVVSGVMIAAICVIVMNMPLRLESGIIYDTRSIIISVTALIFGPVPAAITVVAAAAFRIIIGGSGTWAGLTTILSSAAIGLAWRRWRYPKSDKRQWLNVYVMSLGVHVMMLACQLLLPYPDNLRIIRAVAVPVMLVYPLASVLLCLLLLRQQAFRHTRQQLMESEERFKLLFEKAPLGYQSLDEEGNFLEVNQQWCDLLGYTREEVIGKWFGDFLSPENQNAFRSRFPIFKAQGYIHSEFEMLHKSGQAVFIAFEGRIGYGPDGAFKQTHCILQDITSQKSAEAALVRSESKYRSIAENMSDVIWQMDMGFNTTYVSPSVQKLLGETPEEHMKRKMEEKFPQETLRKIRLLLQEELEKESDPGADRNRSMMIEVEHYRADGTIVPLEVIVSFLRDAQGRATGFLGVSRDITQRRQAEMALEESERSKGVLLSNLQGMAYRCDYDLDWTIRFVSSGCHELTGYSPDDLIGNRRFSFNDLISPEYRIPLRNKWEQNLAARQPFRSEYILLTAEGMRKWVLDIGQGVFNGLGKVEAVEGIIFDISDKKEMEDHLIFVNEHDKLTGLYNREYLEMLLQNETREKDGGKRAIISINLSMVQLLAANYGFHYTQNLIYDAAKALNRHCTENRMLFKTYENRFVFYLNDYKDKNELTDFSEALADTLENLFVTDRISGGIGILEIGQDETVTDVDTLLRRLLIASERSIATSHKNFGITFYNEELEAIMNREGDVRHALSAAVMNEPGNALFLQYQPIIDIQSNTVVAFEALARLRTPDLGLVSPLEFIPVAEKTKLIIPIGESVFAQAFEFQNNLKRFGHDAISVSVNVSVIQLLMPDFVAGLTGLMEKMQVDPRCIGIEITESIFTSDYDSANRAIEKLRTIGISVAIDDFGTGYSSLARQKELKIDCLKIDKYFIDQLMGTDPGSTMVGDIISLAHNLGHCVVAEGVEHRGQMEFLREHLCDRLQGYFIAKPLDEEDALRFLREWRHHPCHTTEKMNGSLGDERK